MNKTLFTIGIVSITLFALIGGSGVATANPVEVTPADESNWFANHDTNYNELNQQQLASIGLSPQEEDWDELLGHHAYEIVQQEQHINEHAEQVRQDAESGELSGLELHKEMKHNAAHQHSNNTLQDEFVNRADEMGVEFSEDDLNTLRANASTLTPEEIRTHAQSIVTGTPADDRNPGQGNSR